MTVLNYLNGLKDSLRLDSSVKGIVLREFRAHLEDKIQELMEFGLSEDEATNAAADCLGPPKLVSRKMYEVYSQDTWFHTIFAALPHIIFASLFALYWWEDLRWLLATLLVVVSVIIYGWCRGKPAWLFPWLGYTMLPLVAMGIYVVQLPGGWPWLAALVYLPPTLIVLFFVTRQTIQKDWLFASLMLLPVPIALGWVMALGSREDFTIYERLRESASLIAATFVVLAVAVAIFMRVRQRWMKAGILLVPQILLLIFVALTSQKDTGLLPWLLLVFLSLFFLASPALLDRRIN